MTVTVIPLPTRSAMDIIIAATTVARDMRPYDQFDITDTSSSRNDPAMHTLVCIATLSVVGLTHVESRFGVHAFYRTKHLV